MSDAEKFRRHQEKAAEAVDILLELRGYFKSPEDDRAWADTVQRLVELRDLETRLPEWHLRT